MGIEIAGRAVKGLYAGTRPVQMLYGGQPVSYTHLTLPTKA